MPVSVHCPLCERPLQVSEKFLGKEVRCAYCGHPFAAGVVTPTPSTQAGASSVDEEERYRIQGEAPLPPPSRRDNREEPLRSAREEDAEDDIARWERRRWRAEETVSAPGTALMVSGAFTLVFGILCLIGMLLFIPEASRASRRPQSNALGSIANLAVLGFFGFVAGPLIILGGWMMKRLRVYQLAFTACILSLVPCHSCWFLALPIGIWGLIVLNKPGLKSMFR